MLKIIGISILIVSTTIAGAELSSGLKKRAEELLLIIKMIDGINAYIRFQAKEITSIFYELKNNLEFERLSFIPACYDGLKKGRPLSEAFSICEKKIEKEMSIKESDIYHLKSLFSSLGKSDIEGQENICALYKKIFQSSLDDARGEAEKKGKLYSSCGVLAGLMLAVFLI